MSYPAGSHLRPVELLQSNKRNLASSLSLAYGFHAHSNLMVQMAAGVPAITSEAQAWRKEEKQKGDNGPFPTQVL